MLRCFSWCSNAALGCLVAISGAYAAVNAQAQSAIVYFGEVAPAMSDAVVAKASVRRDGTDADCPNGMGAGYEARGDLDCGRDSDARRVPKGGEYGNWEARGSGANTAIGRNALASGPVWEEGFKFRGYKWLPQTTGAGNTGAVWADGAHAACLNHLRSSAARHPDPDESCQVVKDGDWIRDSNGKRILVPKKDAATLIERVAERMTELGEDLKTDSIARYFDADGNALSAPSDLSWNTAVGADADARGYRSSNIALGHRAQAWGHGEERNGAANIAVGALADASGSYSNNIAIGRNANASGEDTDNIAIGTGASATDNSIAIGKGVKASDNEVRIGRADQRVFIGRHDLTDILASNAALDGNTISGAAIVGLSADIAANSDSITSNAARIAENADAIAAFAPVIEEVTGLDDRINRANATAAALSAVPNAPLDETFFVGFGVGAHQGESAVAVGASGRLGKEGGVVINAGMANSRDGTTARLGVGLLW